MHRLVHLRSMTCALIQLALALQVLDAATGKWVNTTIALGPGSPPLSVLVTPVAPPGASYAQIRYAPNLWPQCAVYSLSNQVPLDVFVANISSTGLLAPPLPPRALAASLPVHVQQPARPAVSPWTSWKGRAVPPLPPPGVAAATPPLGYNSWNAFHTNLDDNVMRKVADALVSTGLAAAGYSFVNMDDGWQVDRYANGTIVADPARFPYGIRAVADYVHGLGLRFGVYTSQTQFTCQERPGSYEFETVDIDTYCAWGVDYLKVCARMCVGVVNTSRFRVSLGPSTSPRPPPPSPPAD